MGAANTCCGDESYPPIEELGEDSALDYHDSKSFVICHHPRYGYLILYSYKMRKGKHGQLPGGRVDDRELLRHGVTAAPMIAAARELFEETGIDVRENLVRLKPVQFPDGSRSLKGRHFFRLGLSDSDGLEYRANQGAAAGGANAPQPFYDPDTTLASAAEPEGTGGSFRIRLSHEHIGWTFVEDPEAAALELQLHSGGKVAEGFRTAEERRLRHSESLNDKEPLSGEAAGGGGLDSA